MFFAWLINCIYFHNRKNRRTHICIYTANWRPTTCFDLTDPLLWHWLVQCTLECHWMAQCTLEYHWVTHRILAGYTGTPLEKFNWNCSTLECHRRNLLLQPTLEHRWRDCNSSHTQVHIVKQSSIHASYKWQDDVTLSSNRTGLCKFSFYLEFTALRCIPVLIVTRVSTSTYLCTCLGYEHHSSFVYFGLQFKWNQLSSNTFSHTSCIHKELHAGKWPDLNTSKPYTLSTLGYHWTDYTGTTLADAIA